MELMVVSVSYPAKLTAKFFENPTHKKENLILTHCKFCFPE